MAFNVSFHETLLCIDNMRSGSSILSIFVIQRYVAFNNVCQTFWSLEWLHGFLSSIIRTIRVSYCRFKGYAPMFITFHIPSLFLW